MKNMKMKTKLIIGFMVPVIFLIINLIFSDLTTKTAAAIKDPVRQQEYARNAAIFTAIVAFVCVAITTVIAILLIRIIEKSVLQLSDAAKQIAIGHVDIEMEKYNNDEFGELVDEYNKVIDRKSVV